MPITYRVITPSPDRKTSTDGWANSWDSWTHLKLNPTASVKAMRAAKVRFGEPIEVSGDRKVKRQTTSITSQAEASVQAMLDEENAAA